MLDSDGFRFLAYKVAKKQRSKIGWIRYIVFISSFIFVSLLFLTKALNIEQIMFWAFIGGSIAYYCVGIVLAYAFEDNRAFCKYICPITVFLKPMSYFSILRIKCDKDKCISCNKCKQVAKNFKYEADEYRQAGQAKRHQGTEAL